jgi:TPR repeat protein
MSLRPVCVVLALLACTAPLNAAGKRYALLVGVKEHEHAALPALKYSENDVEALAAALKKADYAVVVLTATRGKKDTALAPTAKNVRAQLKQLSGKLTKADLLLLALSGHGLRWPVLDATTRKERDDSFFCPSDARPRSKQTPAELEKTMLPFGELFCALDDSGAGVRLLLDVSHHDGKGGARNVQLDRLPRPKKGTAVLFSCSSGQRSFESAKLGKGHGVFFYHVVQAFESEGNVAWSRLVQRVAGAVGEDAPELAGAKQSPHEVRNLEGPSPVLVANVDPREAATWYAQAEAYYEGRGVTQDRPEALKWYRKAADSGLPLAMNDVGVLYNNGWGVARDHRTAARWYRRAADRGEPWGMNNLGTLHQNGLGVARDYKAAASWYRKAADKGLADAMNNLGTMYDTGQGLPRDEREAATWYRKAADGDNSDAMVNLGALYANGRGVARDDRQAVRWYRQSADLDNAEGMFNLGWMYANGRGVRQDVKEGGKWYRKAADRGNATAMFNLGLMYETGVGIKKDRKEAVRWYRKAAGLGVEAAKKAVERLVPSDL